MAEKLTPQQELAINSRGGKLLVSAAAGSGKTKVLVDRLLTYLIDPVDPANLDDFLIITYTQAAASELRGKIAAKLTERIAEHPENRHLLQQLQRLHLSKISTVHSFCTDVLRENAYRLDIPADFRVAEENECAELQIRALQTVLEEAYKGELESEDFYTLIDSQGAGRDDRSIPEIILKVYKNSRCHLDPEAWLEQCVCDLNGITDVSQCVWGKYLIDDLHGHLDEQIRSYINCVEKMESAEGMEKHIALLRDTVSQLMSLRALDKWDDIAANHDIDYGRWPSAKKCPDLELAEAVKFVRDTLKKKLTNRLKKFADRSEQLIGDYRQTVAAERGLVTLVRKFSAAYEKLKSSRRILDFSDLEHKTLDLLWGKSRSATTQTAVELGRRFREVMVDEYQDSNDVQDAIFSALTKQRQNCFMVGDVKQSIYQFRLADPSIFIDKYNHYVPAETAEDGQGRKVMLSCNFRSSGEVIEAVNDVFAACMSPSVGGLYYGENELLREGIPHVPLNDEAIELFGVEVQENTYAEEAAFVAERIRQLIDEKHMVRDGDKLRPIIAGDIVILLRSPGSTGAWYQKALEQAGIRCATEKGENLFHAEENEVLLSLLKVINNPLLDIPLAGVLLSKAFTFSPDELAKIRGKRKGGSLYAALQESDIEKARAFLDIHQKLRLEAQKTSLSGLVLKIFSLTRIDSIYAAMKDGAVRTENLQAFCRLVSAYEQNANGGLSGLIEHLELLEQSGKVVLADQDANDAVSIMSIHKSKGLEFPVVFLCALSREFNMMSLNAQVLCHKEMGIGLPFVDLDRRVQYPSIAKRAIAACMKAEMISEEMRVLYVAMTRARDRLIMVYSKEKLQKELEELEISMRLMQRDMLISSAVSPGTWIWISSILNRSGKWKRRIVKASERIIANGQELVQKEITEEAVCKIREGLAFKYPFMNATLMPSKQTATQLKGRDKDQEAAENSVSEISVLHTWRRPSFVDGTTQSNVRGTAMHAVMQYIRFEKCANLSGVQQEIDRLISEGYITKELATAISAEQIAAFFATELGQLVVEGGNQVLREFKFSLLVDSEENSAGCTEDRILLQGVVDCALIENDGITVIDFKSDRITDKMLPEAVDRYRLQVKTYAKALEKIYGLPVKSAMLYFFQLNQFVSV